VLWPCELQLKGECIGRYDQSTCIGCKCLAIHNTFDFVDLYATIYEIVLQLMLYGISEYPSEPYNIPPKPQIRPVLQSMHCLSLVFLLKQVC